MVVLIMIFLKVLTQDKFFIVIVVSFGLLIMCGLGDMLFIPLYLILWKSAYIILVTAKFGFYKLLVGTILELFIPFIALLFIKRSKVVIMSFLGNIELVNLLIVLTFIASYFIVFFSITSFFPLFEKESI